MDKCTCVPNTSGHHVNLDFFITTCPDQCSADGLPPLDSSDHSLIHGILRCAVTWNNPLMQQTQLGQLHILNFRSDSKLFSKADLPEQPLISEWILFGIESSIPHKMANFSSCLNVLQTWLNITTTSVSIRRNGVAEPHSKLHAVTASVSRKIQSTEMRRPSKPRLKTKIWIL